MLTEEKFTQIKNNQVADGAVTGIVVTYNSREFIKTAYESVRKFHPNMKIIIVDGSDESDPCFKYIQSLSSSNTIILQPGYNIGHGRGINLAIEHTNTPFVLTFDSDTEMLNSPVQTMLDKMNDTTYGIGYIGEVDIGGHDFGIRPNQIKFGSLKYLHPYFSLIQLKEYRKYLPFIHHGAPAIDTMLDIHRRGLSDKVIKEFPDLGHSSDTYICHDLAGTRKTRKNIGKPEIEGLWDKLSSGMITCITPTGDRPEAFELTKKWMASQTVDYQQWIVVDDGVIPLPEYLREGIEYVRREPAKGEKFTLTANLELAIPLIRGHKIFIIEDDDWYGPNYLKTMLEYLNKYSLVGEGYARYINIRSLGNVRIPNKKHISLCQTGFDVSLLPIFKKCLLGNPFVDTRFWGAVVENKHIFLDKEDKLHLHCSLKGLKGRRGIGMGHDPRDPIYNRSKKTISGLQQLKNWVGEDNAQLYLKHIGHNEESIKVLSEPKKVTLVPAARTTWRDKIALTDHSMIKQSMMG